MTRPRKMRQKGVREQLHVAGADDELDAVPLEPGGHREVAIVAARVGVELEHRVWDGGRFGPLEREHTGDVRGDGGDRQAVVDQSLEVRARARDEDADHLNAPGRKYGPAPDGEKRAAARRGFAGGRARV